MWLHAIVIVGPFILSEIAIWQAPNAIEELLPCLLGGLWTWKDQKIILGVM